MLIKTTTRYHFTPVRTAIISGIRLSHKKNEIMPFAATWMDLEVITLSEVSRARTNNIWYYLHVQAKKKRCKWTYSQNRNRPTDTENKFMVTRAEGGGWVRRRGPAWTHTAVNTEPARTQRGGPGARLSICHKPQGKRIWRRYIYIYLTMNHYAIHLRLIWHCKSTILH